MKCNKITPGVMDPVLAVNCRQDPCLEQIKPGANPIRCLVVDDDLTIINYVTRLLAMLGMKRVKTAQRHTDLVNKLIVGPYELLITDLEMPDMNGYRLTQAVKHDPHDTKTIIMTAHNEGYCLEMMASRWVDGWLFKPFGLKELRTLLASLGLLTPDKPDNQTSH